VLNKNNKGLTMKDYFKFILTTLSLLPALLLSTYAFADSTSPNVELVGMQSCYGEQFKTYDKWIDTVASMQKTEQAAERVRERFKSAFPKVQYERYKERLECKQYTYKVDGAYVNGFYVAPAGKKNLPVLINNRGGNGSYGSWVFTNIYNQLFPLAEKTQMAIFATSYRGAHPKLPGKDEFGGADVADVVALPQLFKHFPAVNAARVGVYGASRGTMQSLRAVQEGLKADALVLYAGSYDFEAELEFRPEMERVYKARIPNYESNKADELAKRSAIEWVDELPRDLPILLIHGKADRKVSVESSISFAKKLKELGFTYKLSLYEKPHGHGYGINMGAIYSETNEWFKRYVKGE